MAHGALSAAGVRRVWAGLQRAAYRGGAYCAASRTACFINARQHSVHIERDIVMANLSVCPMVSGHCTSDGISIHWVLQKIFVIEARSTLHFSPSCMSVTIPILVALVEAICA